MKKIEEIPVYLFCGFFESGKTTFLKSVLNPDGLADGTSTLLIVCEEGEEEYDIQALKKLNVSVVQIEDKSELTTAFLEECEAQCHPQQVLIEYNGMWSMQELDAEILPRHWILYQIVDTVDATTFENYTANMAELMMEKLRNADMIIFNKCTPELKEVLRKRNLKLVNRNAVIYLDFLDGSTEDYDPGVPLFDLSAPVLELTDEDYGMWYTDVNDHPDRYEGVTVRYRGMVAKSPKFPKGSLVAGRFAMVCCANDAQFFGMIVYSKDCNKYKNRDWVWVTAKVKTEVLKIFEGQEGPVLEAVEIIPAEPPENELISF